MKYEAEIDLRNQNTSHALLVELIGREKRVLDVGCAGGDLGRMLKRRGCQVSGVELDPESAQAAGLVLDKVVTGDIGELDLVHHFGEESFDVVVFGDVLEHLADPVGALKRIRPILSNSGAVVASIPNVAHGSVRLALLTGRWDYRPLGLLDSTHLRFFTRGSVYDLLREAGLVAVDMRRTTAGVFDTEISLERTDFDEGVVDAVVGDPDSTTYQFVVRAVLEDGPQASDRQPSRPPPASDVCRVGIWARFEPDDVRHALVMRITSAELGRRLPGAVIRSFSSSDDARPSPHDGGLAVEPLGAWSTERACQLADELDCVVIAGDLPEPSDAEMDGGRRPARFLLEGLDRETGEECPVLWSAVRLPEGTLRSLGEAGASPSYRAVLDLSHLHQTSQPPDEATVAVPDPLLLVSRLLPDDALARRLEYVRIMGWFPPLGPAVVVETGGGLLPHAGAIALALDRTIAGAGAGVVLVRTRPDDPDGDRAADAISAALSAPAHRLPADALVDDLVAVIAGSAALAVCSSSAAALGLAYERPMACMDFAGDTSLSQLAGLIGTLDNIVTQPDELADLLHSERFQPTAGSVAKLQSKLDAHFDRVAAHADDAAAARPRAQAQAMGSVLPPADYVAAMELAYRRMQERLDSERRLVGDHLGELRRRHAALRAERDSLNARLTEALDDGRGRAGREADLQTRLDGVTAELDGLANIRVLRVLRPARAVYARLRGGRL